MHPAVRQLITRPRLARPDLDLDPGLRMTTDGAASFAAASSQSLSVADNASVRIGTGSFWWAGWVNFTTLAASQVLGAKYNGGVNRRSWQVRYEHTYSSGANPAQRIAAYVSSDGSYSEGTTGKYLADTALGAPSTGTWYFVLFWYDAVNQTINLKSNNGATVSDSWTAGIYDNQTDPFYLGRSSDASTFLNGQLDSCLWGKAPPSGITAVINDISAALYNSGNGLAAKDLTDSQRTAWGVVSGWDFDGPSGNLVKDYIGSNTLTNNNTVTYAAGKVVSSQMTADDAVASWFDPYGGTTWSQATAANRPLYKVNILNGYPVARSNGSTQFLSGNAAALNLARKTAGFTMLAVVKYGKNTSTDETVAFISRDGSSSQARAILYGTANYSAGGRHTDAASFVAADSAAAKGTDFVVLGGLLDYSGGPVRVRVNGTQSGSSSFVSPAVSQDTESDAARLFANGAGDSFLQGDIARLLVWRRLLRTDEIRRWERHLGRRYNIAVAG